MNIDPIIPSILHITASEIDITEDLQAIQTKTIGELLSENEKTEKKHTTKSLEQN